MGALLANGELGLDKCGEAEVLAKEIGVYVGELSGHATKCPATNACGIAAEKLIDELAHACRGEDWADEHLDPSPSEHVSAMQAAIEQSQTVPSSHKGPRLGAKNAADMKGTRRDLKKSVNRRTEGVAIKLKEVCVRTDEVARRSQSSVEPGVSRETRSPPSVVVSMSPASLDRQVEDHASVLVNLLMQQHVLQNPGSGLVRTPETSLAVTFLFGKDKSMSEIAVNAPVKKSAFNMMGQMWLAMQGVKVDAELAAAHEVRYKQYGTHDGTSSQEPPSS